MLQLILAKHILFYLFVFLISFSLAKHILA
jgi:hypothetical protein